MVLVISSIVTERALLRDPVSFIDFQEKSGAPTLNDALEVQGGGSFESYLFPSAWTCRSDVGCDDGGCLLVFVVDAVN